MRFRSRRGARLSSRLNTIESLESRTLLSAQMDGKDWLGRHMVDTSYTSLHLRPVMEQPSTERTVTPQTNVTATASLSALSQAAPVPPEFLESLRIVSNADGTSAAIIDYRATEPGVYNAAVRWDGGPAEDVPVDQPGEFWHEPTIGSAYVFREHLSPGEHTLALTIGNASTGTYATTSATFTVAEPEPVPADAAGAGPDLIEVSADPVSAALGEASAPPQVAAVYVSGSAWTTSFKNYLAAQSMGHATHGFEIKADDQLNELPWVNLNTVSVRFSEPVTLSTTAPYDLLIAGVNLASYTVTGMTYDPATYTASWTLSQPIAKDNILLHVSNGVTDAEGQRLDGEWTNGADTFNSGNGVADGAFDFRVNVLPGDADRDGDVDDVDATAVRARFFRSTSNPGTTNPYTAFHDMDGNGSIVAGDFTEATRPERVGPGMGDAEPPTTTVTVPASPGGMTSAALAHNHVELFWEDGSSNETGFRIQRRTAGGSWATLATAGSGVTRYADRSAAANTTYEYRLAAVNAAGVSQYAGTTASTPSEPQSSPTTPIAAPSLSAEDLNNGTIRLTWIGSGPVLEMAAGDENFHPANLDVYFEGNIAGADYEDAQPEHPYRFRLRVDNGEGGWAYSNEVTVVPFLRPYPSSAATHADQVPGMKVSVFWVAEKGRQKGFKVFGRKLPDGAVQELGMAGPEETSLTVPVGSTGEWTFEVLGYDDLVDSPEPAPDFEDTAVTVYVQPNASAPTPELLSAELGMDDMGRYIAELGFEKNFDTTDTTLDWGTNIEISWNGRDFSRENSTFQDEYATFPLFLGTTNTFRLYNSGAAGLGAASETLSVTAPDPSAPVGLAATAVGDRIDLTWSHGERPGMVYVVERKPVTGGYTEVGRTIGTTFSDPSSNLRYAHVRPPVPGAAYTYRVRTLDRRAAYGLYGISPTDGYSDWVGVSINSTNKPPKAPTGLQARAYAGGGVDLRWSDNSAFEERFLIRRTDLTTPAETTREVDEDVAQFHDTEDLIPGHSYLYSVVAHSSGGESAPTTATVTPLPFSGVWIEAVDPTAGEAGPNPGRFIVWRNGTPIDRALTVNFDLSGTATPGVDYAGGSDDASILRNYYGEVIEITPAPDTVAEATETATATLTAGGYTLSGSNAATVSIADTGSIQVDLDIDSDNDNAFEPPSRNAGEDVVEDKSNDASKPGKIIAVNDDDGDGDFIPDFADGFNHFGGTSNQVAGEQFVPVVLELPAGTDFTAARVKFVYAGSNPAEIRREGQGTPEDPYRYIPAPGDLRIWELLGDMYRSEEGYESGGDYITPGVALSAAALGFGPQQAVKFYVEAVTPSTTIGDKRIEVLLDPDGAGPAGFVAADAVRLTSVDVDVLIGADDANDVAVNDDWVAWDSRDEIGGNLQKILNFLRVQGPPSFQLSLFPDWTSEQGATGTIAIEQPDALTVAVDANGIGSAEFTLAGGMASTTSEDVRITAAYVGQVFATETMTVLSLKFFEETHGYSSIPVNPAVLDLTDPRGNLFGVSRTKRTDGASGIPSPAKFSTTDLSQSRKISPNRIEVLWGRRDGAGVFRDSWGDATLEVAPPDDDVEDYEPTGFRMRDRGPKFGGALTRYFIGHPSSRMKPALRLDSNYAASIDADGGEAHVTVPVFVHLVSGPTMNSGLTADDVADLMSEVNTIFSQVGRSFQVVGTRNEPQQTDGLLDVDDDTNETSEVTAINPKPDAVDLYFVSKIFSTENIENVGPVRREVTGVTIPPDPPGIDPDAGCVIAAQSPQYSADPATKRRQLIRTIAHELGHYLMNRLNEAHAPENDSWRVMSPGADPAKRDFSTAEAERIQETGIEPGQTEEPR